MECWYAVVQAYMHAGDPVKVQGLVRIIVDLLQSPDAKEAYGEAVVVSAQVQFLCGYAHYLLCLIKSHQNMSEAERTNALVEARAGCSTLACTGAPAGAPLPESPSPTLPRRVPAGARPSEERGGVGPEGSAPEGHAGPVAPR